jgi:hypothetical protein
MSQLGEKFLPSEVNKEIKVKCPFDLDIPDLKMEEEDYPNGDDAETAYSFEAGKLPFNIPYSVQKNNGGTLGGNLEEGSPGKDGTWNKNIAEVNPKDEKCVQGADIPANPQAGIMKACKPFLYTQKRIDTTTNKEIVVLVSDPNKEVVNASLKPFPFTVAAHHCIPGNEALKGSKLYNFMTKDGKIASENGNKFTIKANIGYNVNGSHNGVWLPGNYAMNKGKYEGEGATWTNREQSWREEYIKAVVAKAPAQFHDRHVGYSEEVKELLDGVLCLTLATHLNTCKKCQAAFDKKLPPPYRLIRALFRMSAWLRDYLLSPPSQWMRPLVASDQFREKRMTEEAFNKWKEETEKLYQDAKVRFQPTH